jgi:hypothetical protein
VAHRPSVPLAGVESCPASRTLFDAGGQVCSDRPPSRLGPVHSDIRVPSDSPFQLDVTPLAVAESRPATDRSVQEAAPHLMMPVTTPAGPRMKRKSAHETSGLPGLAPMTARGSGARPTTPSGPHRSASPPIPIPTRARTSALGGYVTGHGGALRKLAQSRRSRHPRWPDPPGCMTKARRVTAVTAGTMITAVTARAMQIPTITAVTAVTATAVTA